MIFNIKKFSLAYIFFLTYWFVFLSMKNVSRSHWFYLLKCRKCCESVLISWYSLSNKNSCAKFEINKKKFKSFSLYSSYYSVFFIFYLWHCLYNRVNFEIYYLVSHVFLVHFKAVMIFRQKKQLTETIF